MMSPNRHSHRIACFSNRIGSMADRSEASVFTEESTPVELRSDSAVQPAAVPLPDLTTSPERFINRELSWLHFNRRVLEEAENENHPVLERLRFLSISANNLDEFFMVRVAGLKDQVREGIVEKSPDGLTPAEQLVAHRRSGRGPCDRPAGALARTTRGPSQGQHRPGRRRRRHQGREDLAGGPFPPSHLPGADAARDRSGAPVSVHSQSGLHHCVATRARERWPRHERADPRAGHDRALHPPARCREAEACASSLWSTRPACSSRGSFPGYAVKGQGGFRIIRDSDVEIEEEAEDLVRLFESALKRRRRGSVIRLEVDATMPPELRQFVQRALSVADDEVFLVDGVLALNELSQLVALDRPDLKFVPYNPRFPGAHPRSGRRLLRGDPAEGSDRPSSLRIVRRGGAVPQSGRARSERRRDQADAVSHVLGLADREGARRGRRGRQDRHRTGRAKGALRRRS